MTEFTRITPLRADSELAYAGVLLVTESGTMAGQLRDDTPSIRNPGRIGTFGGGVEDGETPIDGAHRELREEISLVIAKSAMRLFRTDIEQRALDGMPEARFFYAARVSDRQLDTMEVYEGQGWVNIGGHRNPLLIPEWVPVIRHYEDIRNSLELPLAS